MIVIKGENGKSLVLENMIRKEFMTDKVVILDAIGISHWVDGEWATVWTLEGKPSHEQVIKHFEDNYEAFKGFDWIGFYTNSNEDSIERFKELDRKYSQNFIVTIQGSNGLTLRYFL